MARWRRINMDMDTETPKGWHNYRALVRLPNDWRDPHEVYLDATTYGTAIRKLKTRFNVKERDIELLEIVNW